MSAAWWSKKLRVKTVRKSHFERLSIALCLEGAEIGPRLIASTYVPLRSGSLFPNVVSFFGMRVAVVDKDDIIVWDFAHDLQTSWPHLFGHIQDWVSKSSFARQLSQ